MASQFNYDAFDINFNEIDAGVIYRELIQSLERSVSEPLYPGDERRIFAEALNTAFVGLLNTMDDTARQKMLRYARGHVLDALGERTDTIRLSSSKAKTTMRFYVPQPRPANIIIPKQTKVTPDGSLYFITDISSVLQANTEWIDIPASSIEGGSIYNDYAPGTITTLVDMIPFISRVENIVTSYGGDDGEPYTLEGDARYRERIRISPSKFSTAGPVGSYKYYALSASPDIIDVKVITPEPGMVTIVPLMKGGNLPDQELLQKILDTVNSDTRRPMTDLVKAEVPLQVPYDISIKYYTTFRDETAVIENVEGLNGAIARYNAWQTAALGCDINPDQLRRLILSPDWGENLAGAVRVDVISPAYTTLGEISVGKFSGNLTVAHEVVKE